jgi:hypothetical protein
VDTYQHQRVLAIAMLIPSHASRVQHMQISEYLLTIILFYFILETKEGKLQCLKEVKLQPCKHGRGPGSPESNQCQ